MGDYDRSTRECTLDTMEPALGSAIRAHVDRYELGDLEASALMCCETTSTKRKKGLFGGKPEVVLTGILLTSQWLVWGTAKAGEAPFAQSARLRNLQAQVYEKSSFYQMIQDTGLNISGVRTDSTEVGSIFIGLGPEPAAEKFRKLLKESIENA